jgi:hypothetical protein
MLIIEGNRGPHHEKAPEASCRQSVARGTHPRQLRLELIAQMTEAASGF